MKLSDLVQRGDDITDWPKDFVNGEELVKETLEQPMDADNTSCEAEQDSDYKLPNNG